MKTQYYGASSLDGFIAEPNDSLDWLLQFGQPERETYTAFIAEVAAIAMGSTTYEWLQRHLQQSGEAWPYSQPCWVFTSRTLAVTPGADIRFVRGDVEPVHVAMSAAANGRNLWIMGGGELAGQFLDAGLLDELIIQITAVTLGAGKPLLPRRIVQPPLELQSANVIGRHFVELRYSVVKST